MSGFTRQFGRQTAQVPGLAGSACKTILAAVLTSLGFGLAASHIASSHLNHGGYLGSAANTIAIQARPLLSVLLSSADRGDPARESHTTPYVADVVRVLNSDLLIVAPPSRKLAWSSYLSH